MQIIFEYGFVYVGILVGDFNIIENFVVEGIIVIGWYLDVLNYVDKDE